MIPVAISKIFGSFSKPKSQPTQPRPLASAQPIQAAFPALSRDEAQTEMTRLNGEIHAAEQSRAGAQRNLNEVRKEQSALEGDYETSLRRQKFDEAGKIRSKIESVKDRVRSAELALQDAQTTLDRFVEQRRTISQIVGRFDLQEWTRQIREATESDLKTGEQGIADRRAAQEKIDGAINRLYSRARQLEATDRTLADECLRAMNNVQAHAADHWSVRDVIEHQASVNERIREAQLHRRN